jgi:hypothetical protein
MVSFKAVSPYSNDGLVFDLPALPPAPLAARSYNEIEPVRLNRLASALYAAYDELGFGDLNWGFWHARCATPHIAPVHFGAIIEAPRNVCADRFSKEIATKIVDDGDTWNKFARKDPLPGFSAQAAAVAIAEVLDGISDTCPECPGLTGP